jgi:uncharacterized protein involved in type VI secretion and phage assembly
VEAVAGGLEQEIGGGGAGGEVHEDVGVWGEAGELGAGVVAAEATDDLDAGLAWEAVVHDAADAAGGSREEYARHGVGGYTRGGRVSGEARCEGGEAAATTGWGRGAR